MISRPTRRSPASHRGLFLFFVVGLFMLQIAFAFTIHGDIGPQSPVVPGIDRPASPLLVGRIDSLITQPVIRQPVRPAPEGAFAPAVKTLPPEPLAAAPKGSADAAGLAKAPAKKDAAVTTAAAQPQIQEKGRYLEYTIERGDTLDTISTKLYGSTRMTQAIVRLNRIRDEKSLQLGDRLLVPRTGLIVRLASR
ncbi:MAG TPA: LysM domain-containing protein [Candidatus Ozemobacteraceae bacterium]|nr:LysM domain-containing protein [Candidatus Ozemobacteraceae bacterium]